jgi:membrane-bound lytic murein transglycosylase D
MHRPSIRRYAGISSFAFLFVASLFSTACGSAIRASAVAVVPPTPDPVQSAAVIEPEIVAAPAPPVEDPVVTLIATSDAHFKVGQRELQLGHVEGAKQEFDKAVILLLESPYGGRVEPRIREYFDRLIDRISTYEVKALAEGDGFTEKKSEPASIDELLALSATFIEKPPAPETTAGVAVGLRTVEHDIDIPLNPRVLAFIELFQGRLHNFLQEGMQRGSKYLPMIQDVFRAEGIPLDLAYVPLVESAFKPNALSKAKAKGVWQFMRGTGLENGLRQDWYIDERSDPEKATVAAAKYLGTLADLFDGNWHLALASYNGGPGRVQKALKSAKSGDFWVVASKKKVLPRETRDYVPMILAAIVIARSPEEYGFTFQIDPPLEYETVTLPKPVDLRHVAEWADTTIDELQSLNPELRRWTTPLKDTAYELKVPMGAAKVVNVRLDEMAASDLTSLASLKWYTVKRSETLATIAKNLHVSRADLAEANFLKITSKVAAGQQLVVPHEATVLMAAQSDRPIPVANARAIVADVAVPAVASGTSPGSDRIKIVYQVKKGDTLSSIARVFRTSIESLQTWNRIPGSQIRTGERLTIYASQAR